MFKFKKAAYELSMQQMCLEPRIRARENLMNKWEEVGQYQRGAC